MKNFKIIQLIINVSLNLNSTYYLHFNCHNILRNNDLTSLFEVILYLIFYKNLHEQKNSHQIHDEDFLKKATDQTFKCENIFSQCILKFLNYFIKKIF